MAEVPGQVPVIPSVPTGAAPVTPPANPASAAVLAAPAAAAPVAAPAAAVPPVAPVTISAPWGETEVWKVGEAGKEQPWWSTIPEQAVRDHIAAHEYKNPAVLAMANYNLTKLQRGATDVIALPGADAPKDVQDAFFTKLGRPADAKGYTDIVKFDVGLPPGTAIVPELAETAKTIFFEAGLNPKQAQGVIEAYNKLYVSTEAARVEKQTTENNTAVDALMTRWGPNLEAEKAAGRRVLDSLGPEAKDLIAKVDNSIGAAPVIELLALIGKKTAEGGFSAGGGPPSNPNDPATMTKEQAQARINVLNADPTFQTKYTTKNHPEHAVAAQEMQALYARL